jgi:hypothetical protein
LTTYIAVDDKTRKYIMPGDKIGYDLTFVAVLPPSEHVPAYVVFEKPGHGHATFAAQPHFVGVDVIESDVELAA